MESRYNRYHFYGDIQFYLSMYTPDIQESKLLLLKVIEQTVRDYCSLEAREVPHARELWEQSRDFIFDDEYTINWGFMEVNMEDILDILDLDISAFREQVTEKHRRINARRKRRKRKQ